VSLDRDWVVAGLALLISLLIFLFNWGAANLSWYGQWVRQP
jgi:hypothetical protein